MIGLIDYDAGNLFSVRRALEHVGHEVTRVRTPAELAACDHLVLPGVGAFGAGVARLRELGLWQPLHEAVGRRVPVLGICLGMQILCRSSSERGEHTGLGVFDAAVQRLPSSVTCPHMGWNRVSADGTVMHEPAMMYFAHSFFVHGGQSDVVCTADHGGPVAAVMRRERVWAVQFHPEKSGPDGLMLLARFCQQ